MQVYELNEIDSIIYELKSGRAIIIETDTQLGLLSLNPKLIYAIKKRPRFKELIRFIYDSSQVETDYYLFHKLANRFWPGPLTLIINKISYRIPDHPILLEILKKINVIYSSSANVSSQNPLKTSLDAFKIKRFLKYEKDLVVIKGNEYSSIPSTIFNVDSGKIIRKGLMYDELVQFLKDNKIDYEENY
ncbi:L-threonylcarbamoyladenylate synthase [Mycoplasmoides pirum]|uniref:L-threonylcarbamoyladenylate synthase n=1 Tax=Mycoplasmoides pirum TaxID=2122 RepID=UPI000487EC2B|nr:Sua5/YciO/YrdC/YwlC family protein [Mycoplasmoides pirum]